MNSSVSCNNAVVCKLCLKYKGKKISHGNEGCALGASTLCRRCHHRGHLSVDCTAPQPQHERPTSLEELIPIDIRLRYDIHTHTPIDFIQSRSVSDLPDINKIIIPDTFNYKELGEFLEKHKIHVDKITKDSREDRIKAAKAWGVANGYRIVQQVTVETL